LVRGFTDGLAVALIGGTIMDDKEQRIRDVAYRLWQEDGRPEGRAEEHWRRACEIVAKEEKGGAKTSSKRAPRSSKSAKSAPSSSPASASPPRASAKTAKPATTSRSRSGSAGQSQAKAQPNTSETAVKEPPKRKAAAAPKSTGTRAAKSGKK